MAKVRVLAGDLDEGDWTLTTVFGTCLLTRPSTKAHMWKGETYDMKTEVARVEELNEERAKSFLGSAGWGLVGAALLGPLGLLAGVLAGGNKTNVAFLCEFKDGRKFMGVTDRRSWNALYAASF